MTEAMTQALQAVRDAAEAKAAKAVEDYKAANPAVDPQAAVDAAQTEDAAAVQALAVELNPVAAPVEG